MELYQAVANIFQFPIIIHSDLKPTYTKKKIQEWSEQNNIQLSTTEALPHQNQVAEAINSAFKNYLLQSLLKMTENKFKQWRKTWPDNFKNIPTKNKIQNKEFRQFFFSSNFINEINLIQYCQIAIDLYNSKPNQEPLKSSFSRIEEEVLNKQIITTQPLQANPKDNLALAIIESNHTSLNEIKVLKELIENNQFLSPHIKKELIKASFILQEPINIVNQIQKLIQPNNQKTVYNTILLTFLMQLKQLQKQDEIYKLNSQLLERIKKLEDQNSSLEEKNEQSLKLINELVKYKNQIQEKEQLKQFKKDKFLSRKRKPLTEPIELHHYQHLILSITEDSELTEFSKKRLRVAFCCLFLTGLRIGELRQITISQIMSLLNRNYIKIDRQKRGRSNQKAFLTTAGSTIIKKRREDIFDILKNYGFSESKNINFFDKPFDTLFLFSSQKQKGRKPLTRTFFTNHLNTYIHNVFKNEDKNFTSHSFRKGYITRLWRESSDIEFVRSIIGHTHISTTSLYTKELSDEEKQKKLEEINAL